MISRLLLFAALAWPTLALAQAPDEEGPQDDSAAVRLAHTRDSIAQGKEALANIQKRLDDPAGEYVKAEADFQFFDKKVTQARLALAKLKKDPKAQDVGKREAELADLKVDWELARGRFDLAIRERKAMQEAVAGINIRVARDQEQLDRLEGKPAAPPPDAGAASGPGAPVGQPAAPAPAPGAPPTGQVLGESKAIRQARHKLEALQAELADSEAGAKLARVRVRALDQSIRTIEKLTGIEREILAHTEKMVARFGETARLPPPADEKDLAALQARLADAQKRQGEARSRIERLTDRVTLMNESLQTLKEEQTQLATEADARKKGVEAAENELTALLHPLAWANMLRWVARHGPNLAAILCGMLVLHVVTRQLSRRIVRLAALNSHRGTLGERENRASTLVGVFRYAATLGIFVGGAMMLLDESGVPVVPLMGGAAVFGLAAAFGAQNLIRDYFTGFMMLMEDQYSVNDVVKIGAVSGLVEKITLRVTVLRDLEGVRHFIPHGGVNSVSNMTHGWSRAMFDIAVSYSEDVDRVIRVLRDLGAELRNDPELGIHIIEDPEMLGVEALDKSQVTIRFLIKTRPLQQWPVRREMLRRIKKRFAEIGIATPGTPAAAEVKAADPAPAPLPFPSLPDKAAG